jgi:hypothetical protein
MFKKVEGMSFYELNWRKGAKCVKLVVGYSLLVDVSVHRGMLTMAGSWWGKKVITPLFWFFMVREAFIEKHQFMKWVWESLRDFCNMLEYGSNPEY